MNKEVRELFESIIAILNQYNNVPMETKRLMRVVILQMVEKQADELISLEYRENKDAESI